MVVHYHSIKNMHFKVHMYCPPLVSVFVSGSVVIFGCKFLETVEFCDAVGEVDGTYR